MVQKLETLKRVPASINRGIGRLLVADSYLDLALVQIVYDLVGVGQKEGRLAIREPRAVERLELIEDLAHVHGIKLQTDLKLLREALEKSTSNRDLVGHGIWFREPTGGGLLVRRLRGSWPKDKTGFRRSRRILPQGEHIDEEELAIMLELTEKTIQWIQDLHNEIRDGLKASPRKPL